MAPPKKSEWANVDLTNLTNSLSTLTTSLNTDNRRRGVRRSNGPSREEAEQDVRYDLEKVAASPLNQYFKGGGEVVSASSQRLHTELKRLLNSKFNLLHREIPARRMHRLKDRVASVVRELDSKNPFLEDLVAAKGKSKSSASEKQQAPVLRKSARIAERLALLQDRPPSDPTNEIADE